MRMVWVDGEETEERECTYVQKVDRGNQCSVRFGQIVQAFFHARVI